MSWTLKVGEFEVRLDRMPIGTDGEVVIESGPLRGTRVRYARRGPPGAESLRLFWPDAREDYDLQRSESAGQVTYDWHRRQDGRRAETCLVQRPGEDLAQGGATSAKRDTKIKAQMPGRMVRILVTEGQAVEKGTPLLVMEAMKMENEIRAPGAGVVKRLAVQVGQTVETGAELLVLG